jgi:hypothetical protein
VGIVADPALHPLDELNTFDKAMAWLQVHQPQLHRDLQGKRGLLQDFAFFKRFSYGCKKVYSGADRWALTGEAGLFLDPFYSPGGDFIAMSNTFITELVVQDHADVKVSRLAGLYERIYFRFYEAMLPLYVGQYRMFGNAEVLPMKVLWDYTFYWGVMCLLFFQNRLTDVMTMARLQAGLAEAQQLNVAVQDFLRAWDEAGPTANPPRLLDQASLPWFAELNRSLMDELDDAQFAARMTESLVRLRALAAQLMARAKASHPALDGGALTALLAAQPVAESADLLFPA